METNVDQAAINAVAKQVESMIQAGMADKKGAAAEKSVGSDVLKDLVSELSADGKLDKSELNVLKLFLDLLNELAGKAEGAPAAGGGAGGSAAPAAGGGGSQAPPAAAAPAPAPTAPAPTAAPAPAPAPAAEAAEPKAKPEAKAEAKPEAKADGKPESKTEAQPEPKAEAKSEAKAEGNAEKTPTAMAPQPAPSPAPAPVPAASARDTYNSLKGVAMADGVIDPNERTALTNAARALGINDPDLNPKSLGETLKQIVDIAMLDGKIDNNEAQGLGAMIDAIKSQGGNGGLAQTDVQKMLTDVMAGTSADGSFADGDLATFNKVLSLMSPSSGGGSGGWVNNTGGSTTPQYGSPDGLSAQKMANYLFGSFMTPANLNAIMASLAGGSGMAGGGLDVSQMEEQKASGSQSA